MRYAILHCRSCAQPVWVPKDKLGQRGHCPRCERAIVTPSYVPEDNLVEGPPIMHEYDPERELAETGSPA